MYTFVWLIHVDAWQKQMQYCKAIILQLKTNFFFFLKKCMPAVAFTPPPMLRRTRCLVLKKEMLKKCSHYKKKM